MKHLLHRADTEALLEGQPLGAEHPLGDVQAFFTAMRTDFAAQPAPEPRPVLASILDGRRPLRPVPVPTPEKTVRPASWPRWSRGLRPVAVAFATGTLLVSGLAAAGALPAPLQRVGADLGTHVGLDLPRPSEPAPSRARLDPPAGSTGTPAVPSGPRVTVPAAPDPTAETVPATLEVPETLPAPSSPPLTPSITVPSPSITVPAPLGPVRGGLLPGLPEVSQVAPGP